MLLPQCEMMRSVSKGKFKVYPGILLGLIMSCAAVRVSSQLLSDSYQFEVWKTERGLPQNTVLSVRQSRDGYLWIGTLFGLARFDGVHFTAFNSGNTRELVSENCTTLAEDSEG